MPDPLCHIHHVILQIKKSQVPRQACTTPFPCIYSRKLLILFLVPDYSSLTLWRPGLCPILCFKHSFYNNKKNPKHLLWIFIYSEQNLESPLFLTYQIRSILTYSFPFNWLKTLSDHLLIETNQPIYTLSPALFWNARRDGLLNVFWLDCIEKKVG